MLNHFFNVPQKPKRVVIIGAGGFIGKELANTLREQDIPTLLITRNDIELSRDDASSTLEGYLKPDDRIVFLSAITPDKGKDIGTFIKNCKIGQAVSDSIKKVGCSHLIYFSSDAVYPMTLDIINEDTVVSPEDLYGVMHRARELMMQSLTVPVAIVRPTIVFGFGDTHNSYGPNRFIREAFAKGTITLFGKGEEKRSHIFIDDVIKSIFEMICRQSTGLTNLVSNQSISFLEVSELIKKKMNKKIDIITSERANPITHRHFDMSVLYKSLPSINFTNFEDGLSISMNKMDPINAPN